MSKEATKAQPETPDSVVPGAAAVAAASPPAEQRVHNDVFFFTFASLFDGSFFCVCPYK